MIANRQLRKVGGALIMLGGLMYAGVFLEMIVGFPLDPKTSYLSELLARDQQFSARFRLFDALSSSLILAGLAIFVFGAKLWPRWEFVQRLMAVSLGVAAAFTLLDSVVVMDCAKSLPQCRAR